MKTTKTTEVKARIVYDLERPHLLGAMYSIDRVIVDYVNDSEDDDDPFFDITIKGWRLTSKMTVDQRQKVRENVYLPRSDRTEFLTDDLGIDYLADVRELLQTPVTI